MSRICIRRQSTLETIINRASHYAQPTIEDLEVLKPQQIPIEDADKTQLYHSLYKRVDGAFTKAQLRHLIRELSMRSPSKTTKHNLVDSLLARWGVHSESYIKKQRMVDLARKKESSAILSLPDHALFLLLGQDGQGHQQLLSPKFGVKVGIRRAPKLALSITGTHEGVDGAKAFLQRFIEDVKVVDIQAQNAAQIPRAVLLGVSRISNAYVDPQGRDKGFVKVYAQTEHDIEVARRLLSLHLSHTAGNSPVVVAPDAPLTILPYDFRDERPWDFFSTPYRLGALKDFADGHERIDIPQERLFEATNLLSNSSDDVVEIELGHYLYQQEENYVAKTEIDTSALPTPRFIPSVNPAALKIANKGESPELRLVYSLIGENGEKLSFISLLSQTMDGHARLTQSLHSVTQEGLVLPGCPTDARISKHHKLDTYHGLDHSLGSWLKDVEATNRMPPLSLMDERGLEWHLEQHLIIHSAEVEITPGLSLRRESVVNNESNQSHEAASIVIEEGSTIDKESIYEILTQKWAFVYDQIKWSRPPREYQPEESL
ncbi:hypothetical protein E3Q22_01291 [Wallemia mellicola]|uniref:Uncharacterized protein n=2 Tax=Wallemia mellicola TaxID=1708541 RepID=A0A4T0NBY3_9BASI|nr:hypothetical protein WALSEDRAFT_56486 [Wallemia mellicola CBS 633.66]TIB81271.1 hypothetical protein E3Q22_01291 [Wallemia mellicola]EIM23418.1 hypothetical protein WALSEDRAFT_56486 [Wallemia mellicola CBS 633.66]TIB94294.1 hypothetical protein E3Q19_00563 [Wallemia mellicola]TIC03943.1 hypothetical protein E3Q17_00691 [Wallemia mellicola]TIC14470.1 hypothetical protein E3Q14_00776 [Wallemia mellicola]|eukprot:XP_006956794.1 hypothetical protein WALSEDRAFT_56486 [Wallemia mellicola CBS 633.66]